MFAKSVRSQPLFSMARRSYTRMSTEQYLKNIRESLTNMNIQRTTLNPLLEANHTSDT